jgi:hypothetical protein
MRAAYLEVLRNLTFKTIKLETRLSDRQVAQLRWSQIHGNVIRTTRMRDCMISREVTNALALLPHKDPGIDFVFFGNSLSYEELEGIGELQERMKRPKRRFLVRRTKETHKRVDKRAMIC